MFWWSKPRILRGNYVLQTVFVPTEQLVFQIISDVQLLDLLSNAGQCKLFGRRKFIKRLLFDQLINR